MDLCACKLTHIYVPCFEILSPLFMLQNPFLSYCKWAESALSVFKTWIVHSGKAVEHIINKTNVVVDSAPRCPRRSSHGLSFCSLISYVISLMKHTQVHEHVHVTLYVRVSGRSILKHSCLETMDVPSPTDRCSCSFWNYLIRYLI